MYGSSWSLEDGFPRAGKNSYFNRRADLLHLVEATRLGESVYAALVFFLRGDRARLICPKSVISERKQDFVCEHFRQWAECSRLFADWCKVFAFRLL